MYSTVWECLSRKFPHRGKKESDIMYLLAVNMGKKAMLKIPKRLPVKEDSEYDDGEVVAWNRLNFFASPCTSRDREIRLTATQVLCKENKSTFEPPKAPSTPVGPEVQGSNMSTLSSNNSINADLLEQELLDRFKSHKKAAIIAGL